MKPEKNPSETKIFAGNHKANQALAGALEESLSDELTAIGITEKLGNDLLTLSDFAARAEGAVAEGLASIKILDESDHFSVMANFFCHKQFEHSRAIALLVSHNAGMQANIIARTMLEGSIYLAWSNAEKNIRAKLWRSYSLVQDYKLIVALNSANQATNDAKLNEIEKRLKSEGDLFLSKNANKYKGRHTATRYIDSWHIGGNGEKISLKQMSNELMDPNLKELYDDLSQTPHWTPRGVAKSIYRNPDGIVMNYQSTAQACQAQAVRFSSLTLCARLLFDHLRNEALQHISRLELEYKENFSELLQQSNQNATASQPV